MERSKKAELTRRRSHLTTRGRVVVGGLALTGAMASGAVVAQYHENVGNAIGVAAAVATGSEAPSQTQLKSDPKESVTVEAGNTVNGIVNTVDPEQNEATQWAIGQYIIDHNHGSTVIEPGQVVEVPEVNRPPK